MCPVCVRGGGVVGVINYCLNGSFSISTGYLISANIEDLTDDLNLVRFLFDSLIGPSVLDREL